MATSSILQTSALWFRPGFEVNLKASPSFPSYFLLEMPIDPLLSLKARLEAASVPIPDDGTLQSLLLVSNGNVVQASQLIIDDHRASNPSAASSSRSDPSATLRRRQAASERQELGFAETEEEYEAAIRGSSSLAATRRAAQSRGANGGPPGGEGLAGILYSALTLPFSALQSLLVAIARLLRLPSLFGAIFASYRGPTTSTEAGRPPAAQEFAQRLQRAQGASVSPEMPIPPHVPLLIGPYNDALRQAKEELRMLVVILATGKEDREEETFFKTLASQPVASAMSRPEVLVWGASVRRREGHLVSRQLAARQFPYMGCIAMKSTTNRMSAFNTSPQLSLISSTYKSAMSTPNIISEYLQDSFSRCSPFLDALQAEKIARDTDRRLMAEQDRAYQELLSKDAEKIERKRSETRARQAAEEQRRREEQEREAQLMRRVLWQRWAKHHLVPANGVAPGAGATTINVVLPDGRRLFRVFSIESSIEHVYAWIESAASSDVSPDEVASISYPEGYTHVYEFALFHGYPRVKLGPEAITQGLLIKDVAGLSPRANIIVEGKVGSADIDESSTVQSTDVSEESGSESEEEPEKADDTVT